MTDRRAEDWRHPERHIARRVERRDAAEMTNLMTLDAMIRTYGMDADELTDLMLQVRWFYRGGGANERQERFLSTWPVRWTTSPSTPVDGKPDAQQDGPDPATVSGSRRGWTTAQRRPSSAVSSPCGGLTPCQPCPLVALGVCQSVPPTYGQVMVPLTVATVRSS